MSNIPSKVEERLKAGIKKFQPIVANAKSQDLNETDTVRIISGILEEVLGYDRYLEISSEMNIKGSYCDLCLKIDNEVQILIEAKAVGIELKSNHLKQVVDYAVNKGIDWVILTNGINWNVYKVMYSKPINQELIIEFDFLSINHKNASDLADLFLLTKEAISKTQLEKYYTQKKALSKYYIGAIILNEAILDRIRREIKMISPDVRVTSEQIETVIMEEVLKREIIESEKFNDAQKAINKIYNKKAKVKAVKDEADDLPDENKVSQGEVTKIESS